jgi:hypothetical protein
MIRFTLLFFLQFALALLYAQAPMYKFGDPVTSSGTMNYPLGVNATGARTQTAYNAGSFGSITGLVPITRLYFATDTMAVDTITFSNVSVTMGDLTSPPSLGFAWMSPPPGAVQVLSGATIQVFRDSGWVYFDLPTSYIYDASNGLYLDIRVGSQTPYTAPWRLKSVSGPGLLGAANPGAGSPNTIYLGSTVILGFDIYTGQNNASVSTIILPSVCANNQDAQVKVSNSGTNVINNVTVEWTINGVPQSPVFVTGPIDTFGSANNDTIITLGNVSFISGPQNIKAWTSQPNSTTDPFNLNDTVTFTMSSALNGSYTIGSSGNFTTITDAVNAIRSYGVCAPVTFLIDSGTYVSQIDIVGRINGASPTNTITFRGIDRDKTILSWSALAVNSKHVVKFQNTAYITFRDMTIKPTGATNAWGMQLLDTCVGITIKNCVFDLSSAATSTGNAATVGITVSGNATGICIPGPCATPLTTGVRSDSLLIDSNIFMYGYSAINVIGSAALKGRYNTITNNSIYNAHQNSINLVHQDNVIVDNNKIITGGAGVTNLGTGIACNNVLAKDPAWRTRISRNRIFGYTTAGISITTSVNTDSSNKALVINNMIGGAEQSPDANGLIITDSKNWSIANNTINRDFSGTTAATASGIRVVGTTTSKIALINNIVAITKPGLALPLYIADTLNIDTMDRNVLYRRDISNSQVLNMNSTNYLVSNFKGARGFNQNSEFTAVSFKNDTNLSLQSICGLPTAMPLSYVSIDIDSNLRSATPVPGAEENLPSTYNIALTSIRQPASPITTGAQSMSIVVKNLGTTAVNNFTLTYQYNGYAPTSQVITLGSPLNTCDSAIVAVPGLVFAAGDTMIRMTVYTSWPNSLQDEYTANDTLKVKLYTPLTGTYTLGGPGADFETFGDAAYALRTAGISGAVTFMINPGTYTEQLTLTGPVAGSSPVNTITFDGVDNNTRSLSFAGNSGLKHTVQIDNLKYVTIRNLSINTLGSTWGYGVHITNGANGAKIKNCNITISGSGSTNTTVNFNPVVISGATPTTASRTDSVEIDSNTISYGYYGIAVYASTGAANIGQFNRIRNNTILNAQQYSVYLVYQQTPEVFGNVITCRGAAAGVGIYCQNVTTPSTGSARTNISRNRISSYGAAGISINTCANASNQLKGRILNNVVGGQEKAAGGYGIYLNSSTNWSICNNTVNRDYITTTADNAAALRIQGSASASFGNTVMNNIFALSGNGTSLPLYTQVAANTDTLDYNLYYRADTTTNNNVVYIAGALNINTFRTSTFNRNSLFYRPGFTSSTDLTPNIADSASWSANGRGTHISYVNTDMNGVPRAVIPYYGVPDIGAYEYTPEALPPMAKAIPDTIIGGTVQTFTFATDTVARIYWPSIYSGSSATEIRQFSGQRPINIDTFFNYMYFYDRISSLPVQPDSLLVYYRDNWKGTHTSETGIKLIIGDTSSFFWQSQITSFNNGTKNIISMPYYGTYTSYINLTGADGALVPVKMLSFRGEKQNADAKLTWITASERNASRFEIQRSANRKNWTALGSVKATGNSNTAALYEYTDRQVFATTPGTLYYRLKAIDFDGSYEFSEIVAIESTTRKSQTSANFTLFPNPFSSELYMQLNVPGGSSVEVRLTDITGKELYAGNRVTEDNENIISLQNLPELKPGVYLVSVSINGSKQVTQKLIRN